MKKRNQPQIAVPEGEVARQATDSLGGYIYQIEQSVLSWLRLGDAEVLHIEFAEDIAVSADGVLDLTQVKRLSENITLRSNGVLKLLTSIWDFQKKNLGLRVTGALLTTSGIGKERKLSFPGKLPGLLYWRIAARAGANVEPIRKALLALALPSDMLDFIKSASASELQSRILQPVRWLDEGPDDAEVRRRSEEQLILLGDRIGVPPTQSKNVRAFLIEGLLDVVRRPADTRFVTRADLLEIFENKTFVTVPPGLLAGLSMPGQQTALSTHDGVVRDVTTIPLSRLIAPREDQITKLIPKLVTSGTLWFHGSSGLGKSTLAILLARSQRVSWRFADLRDFPANGVRSILASLANTFAQSGARGLILDDFPQDADNSLISALGELSQAVRDADGLLIVTSTRPPQPSLKVKLEVGDGDVIRIPYLSESDVAGIVSASGGNPKAWARSIRGFAGGGHPQLVAARVAGLARRGWEIKEALGTVIPLPDIPDDLEEERKAVRTRLLQELDDKSLELLLRLSLLHANFGRDLALVAAGVPPPVAQPGLVFDYLVGPWIEQVAPERYRLSPLLSNSGATSLAAALQNAVKRAVMDYLMAQRPFPADQLLQVFLIAFQLSNMDGLSWFGHALLGASTSGKAQFKRLAQEVSVFALVDRGEGKPLIPQDQRVSTLLRITQLRVAVATGDMKQAAVLVDRTLAEGAAYPPSGRKLLNGLVYGTVMIETRIPMGPARWLPMLIDLVAIPEMKSMFTAPLPTDGLFAGLPVKATHEEMLFIARATSLRSPAELGELFEALVTQPKKVRARFMGVAARTNKSLHLIVAGSWLNAVKQSEFDGKAAADTYRTLSKSQLAKENADLAVELLCAEAVMRDEYADDEVGALEALEAGQKDYPNDYRLSRQRQKVFYRHRRHAEALAEFEKFKDQLPKDRAVDRAYAMREAGRSAAETGDLEKASNFFHEAWESARVCGDTMRPMTAGLSADCAIVAFDRENVDYALELMRRSLTESEPLDPKAGLKEAYVKRAQGAAIIYMRGAASNFPVERQARVYGMCSDPEPDKWFGEQPVVQPEMAWYQLAELEAESGSHDDALKELRKRTSGGGLMPLEWMLSHTLVEAAIRDKDVDRFMEYLPVLPRVISATASGGNAWRQTDPFKLPKGKPTPLKDSEWGEEQYSTSAKAAVLCFILVCAGAGRPDLVERLKARVVATPGLNDLAQPLFLRLEEPSDGEKDVFEVIPSIAGRLLIGDVVDARDVFHSAVYILQFLNKSGFGGVVADAVMPVFDKLWPEILAHRTFSMRSPSTNGPIILEALRKGASNLQRMANMVLAAEAAVNKSLGGIRATIVEVARGKARVPIPEID